MSRIRPAGAVAQLLSFQTFAAEAGCPKCGVSGWYPRVNALWHPATDGGRQRDCPAAEHLHAACPCCGFPSFYAPADAAPGLTIGVLN